MFSGRKVLGDTLWLCYVVLKHLHDDRTLLTPDALGGVLGLHVGGHAVLHGARDVLVDHVGTVVSAGTKE